MAATAEQLKQADFGVLGIAVMGENLAMNIEDHGFSVAVCNLRSDRVTPFMKRNEGKKFIGAHNLEDFVKALKPPRRVMLMVKAGDPVDDAIKLLKPLLSKGDIIIDGGNSWFKDTQRREAELLDQHDGIRPGIIRQQRRSPAAPPEFPGALTGHRPVETPVPELHDIEREAAGPDTLLRLDQHVGMRGQGSDDSWRHGARIAGGRCQGPAVGGSQALAEDGDHLDAG